MTESEWEKKKGNKMNQTIYDLADSGGTIRIAIQKKNDGTYILGVSNGKTASLICQGDRETVDREFESRLPNFLKQIREAAIEAKLKSVTETEEQPSSKPVKKSDPVSNSTASAPEQTNEQPELDFGF